MSGPSLLLKRGNTEVRARSRQPWLHREKDFEVELTSKGLLMVRTLNGTPFLTVDFAKQEATMDLLNVPYVDVGKRAAEAEKLTIRATKVSNKE